MKLLAPFAVAAAFFMAATVHANEAAAPKIDLVAGAAKFAETCVECHGTNGTGTSPAYPNIAGQFPAYLVKQLQDLKSGKRSDPVMSVFAQQLSEPEMRNIAAWLSTQKPEDNAARDRQLVMMGERIYRGGIVDRNIPACAGCHSPNGAGIPAQYPRVAGQHAVYTEKQLNDFRNGTRTNHPIMNDVAAKMNDKEIKAVSDYMAGLR